MDLSTWLLIYILAIKINHIYALSKCPESLSTVVNVVRCPKNKEEWECQSKNKRCSKVPQSCAKPEEFLYHCLMNEYMNMTIEVCAPSVNILGHKCAEFNMGGTIVQDNAYAKCNDSVPPCPFRYNSTDMYKYQMCYSYIKREDNILPCLSNEIRDQNICSCDENTFLIVSIIFIYLWANSCAALFVVQYRYRKLRQRTLNRRTADEGANDMEVIEPMQPSSETDKDEITTEKNVTPANQPPPNAEGDEISTKKDIDVTPSKEPPFRAERDEVGTDKDANSQNKSSLETYKDTWVYSIYIGDKYCGMAYLNPKSPESIVSLGDHEIIGVLVTKDGEIKEFGDKARKMFIENREDSSDYIFLDHEKLDIELGNDNIPKLPSMKIIDIYQRIIGFLVRKIVETVAGPQPKEGTACKSESCILCNMHCVITVPHHWKGYVRDLREAFDKTMAEIHENVRETQLHIKLREVAISPYIHEVKAPVTCLNFNVDNLIFKENTTCVNLHVGSKYCNLTFLSAPNPESPDWIIVEPYRQQWKKKTPEAHFVKLLKDLFSEAIFKEWKEKYYWEYISLMFQFEDQKNKMRENMDDNVEYEFRLSSTLLKIFEDGGFRTTTLRDRVTKEGGKLEIKDGACSIIFNWSFLKNEFFTHAKNSTKEIIRKHKQEFDNRGVRCVIMTGSFSQMKLFLHEAETEWFKEFSSPVTVVIPVHIGSTYAMGAAYFFKKYPTWIFHDLISNK